MKKAYILFLILFAGAGGYLIRSLAGDDDLVATASHPIRDKNTDFRFISPLLVYDLPKNVSESKELKNRIQDYITQKKAAGQLDEISVYVRPVTSGGWAGVNENTKYQPASLLKVPLMIAYFKWAESDPAILDKVLSVLESPTSSADTLPSHSLKSGDRISVDKLIRLMIVESDNLAFATLSKSVDPDYLIEVFSDLGIEFPEGGDVYSISAKEYALFFRILYNATYLNSGMSERALSLLHDAKYGDGIPSGVPDGVVVAHKYGERVIRDGDFISSVELHDCGIIYLTDNPYILCIMTKGNHSKNLTEVISEISRSVFRIMSDE